jgi:beta-galactosidase/beta-glucuronidase
MTIPGTLRDGGLAGHIGRVSFQRSFGKPTNLDADEQVWLVFEHVVGAAEVLLNGETLGTTSATARFEIKARLAVRNELVVEIDAGDDGCGIVGEVRLEIQ